MISTTRPVGGVWVLDTNSTTSVTLSAGASKKAYGYPVYFGADGFTLYLKLDSTSVGSSVSCLVDCHVTGDETVGNNYAQISTPIVPNPTTLTSSWQAFNFTPSACRYLGFELTNREGVNAVKFYAMLVYGG